MRAARKALVLKLGRPLAPGEVTRHKCDVAKCVNPNHLEPGTQADNNRDTARRYRSNGPCRKITPALRVEAAARYMFGGITQHQLAREYGVSQVMISRCYRMLKADPSWRGYLLCSF